MGPQSIRRRPDISALQFRLYQAANRFLLHFENFLAAERLGKAAYIAAKSRRLGDKRRRWMNLRRIPLPPVLQRVQNAIGLALEAYVPGPYGGRVTLVRANRTPARLRGRPEPRLEPARARRGGGVEVHEVPGYHGALVYERRVGPLVRHLVACLERGFRETDAGKRAVIGAESGNPDHHGRSSSATPSPSLDLRRSLSAASA